MKTAITQSRWPGRSGHRLRSTRGSSAPDREGQVIYSRSIRVCGRRGVEEEWRRRRRRLPRCRSRETRRRHADGREVDRGEHGIRVGVQRKQLEFQARGGRRRDGPGRLEERRPDLVVHAPPEGGEDRADVFRGPQPTQHLEGVGFRARRQVLEEVGVLLEPSLEAAVPQVVPEDTRDLAVGARGTGMVSIALRRRGTRVRWGRRAGWLGARR